MYCAAIQVICRLCFVDMKVDSLNTDKWFIAFIVFRKFKDRELLKEYMNHTCQKYRARCPKFLNKSTDFVMPNDKTVYEFCHFYWKSHFWNCPPQVEWNKLQSVALKPSLRQLFEVQIFANQGRRVLVFYLLLGSLRLGVSLIGGVWVKQDIKVSWTWKQSYWWVFWTK